MPCPNINSSEWKSLVSTIGAENAWREFFKYGEIPDASIYEVEGATAKAGVKELLNSNPELAAIGTAEQYSAYLDSIFPDSKVKDIVYHHSSKKLEAFDKSFLGKETSSPDTQLGFFFAEDKNDIPKMVMQKNNQLKELGSDKRLNFSVQNNVLLNIKNPEYYYGFIEEAVSNILGREARVTGSNAKEDYKEARLKLEKNNKDSLIYGLAIEPDGEGGTNVNNGYVIFEPEQIHILGSQKDIEGFKKFKENIKAPKKVLYSIKTKTPQQLAKGINAKLIKSEKQIKYTNFIQALVLNKIGDITPNKVLTVTPTQAFASAKSNFGAAIKNINDFVAFVKTPEKFNTLKEKDPARFSKILESFYLQNISSFEEAVEAGLNYKEIVDNFDEYEDYVTAGLLAKGLKISKTKNTVTSIDPKDKEDSSQDETEDNSLPNSETNSQKFDTTIFEVNPYDTATIRVKAMVQTIKTGEYEMGIPLYADPNDVLDDMLYAGVSMNLSGFKDKASKLDAFCAALAQRKEGRPYIDELLQKINAAEQKGDWAIINQILTFASKAFANEELLLYTLRRTGAEVNGVTDVKIIGGNRDTILEQIKRDWLSKHQIANFYNKAADGSLTPKPEKLKELDKIRKEGISATGDAQKQKFIDYFNVLGIKFTMKDMENMTPKIKSKFNKEFKVLFTTGNLLDNIHNHFVQNINEPFQGQYGFQNEGREMGYLAQLYFDATPNVYKAGATKTADGKTKYLYIQTNHAEISKREFENGDGTSVTNTALAKPNLSFWNKVKNSVAKFVLGYFNGSREQKEGKDGKVRKNYTEKEQIVNMILGHQADMKEGTYTTFTLSDKTTSMQAKMTKEFFVDEAKIPVGSEGKDYSIVNDQIVYSTDFKRRIYNSFAEPEISRILASIKHGSSINLENFATASKLFYFFPRLNADPSLDNFRNDLYSGKLTIEELKTKHGKAVAEVIIDEFDKSSDAEITKFIKNGVIKVEKGNYKFPVYKNSYVNRFKETEAKNRTLAKLMSMDMKLNYMNSQIKTVQFLKFDPMHAFKASKDLKGKSFDSLTGEDKIKLANATWDEFSKRAASLIAPGSQGSWSWKYAGNKKTYDSKQVYRTVTLKDVEKSNEFSNKTFETTDAQEFVTMQEHIDYLMSEGRIPLSTWESVYDKIEKAGKGGYYELTKEELGHVLTPMKPVYAGSAKEGPAEGGLTRYDYVKSSRYPLIPQHEAGSERDKLRIWMEKNDIQSANFASGKKLGRPALSVVVFDKDNNFIEPKDFEKGLQELSRDGLRNQQEIPHQKREIATVSQMNRTLFDGLLESTFNFSGMKDVSGMEMKAVKEAIRSKMFDNAAAELRREMGDLNKTNVGLYKLLKKTILEDTTGSYTKNDLRSLALNEYGMFEIPLEAQFKFPKFQGLINSMINKNVMLKVEGTSLVQVSGAGAKYNFNDLGKNVKSDIIWTDKFAKTFKNGNPELKYISKNKQGQVQAAQVIVSQYIRDGEKLVDLKQFITEDKVTGVKILDTSRLSPEMLQLVASRIPNQSHVSMLPIEVVGFLPSYMEDTIIVPDGITGQMGSDFDVDKLFAYTSKFVKGKNAKGEVTYGPVEYNITNSTDVAKLSPDQLTQVYRDMHWNVLMHEDTFEKITKSVDMDEVKDKVSIRKQQLADYNIVLDKGANLPLDYQTSISRFIDNKSGKDGVSIYANLISAQADLQDKPLTLGKYNKVLEENEFNPVKIKLSKNGEIIDLLYIGKTGSSKSFLYEKDVVPERSISDNLNIQFTESVDNAKNQFLREFGWDNKSMGAMGMLTMLTDENGQAVPIEFMMDLTSQSSIKDLLENIDLKQDSFGVFKPDALQESVVELQEKIAEDIEKGRYLEAGLQAGTYLGDESRDNALDPETLSDMWIVGQAIKAGSDEATLKKLAEGLKYKSVDDMMLTYYTTQYDSLELFSRLNGLGKELMTMLGSMYTYTKGIGASVFIAKQKMNQLNKLSSSENFLGIKELAGDITKDKDTGLISIIPKGELGASIEHSLIVAQTVYGYLFPIATGKNLESTVTTLLDGLGLKLDDVSKDRYETVFNNAFKSTMHFLYTHPDLELFEDVRATRDRLINGDNSLAKRIEKLKTDPKWAKNGLLKNLETSPVWMSDIQTIALKAPFGTQIDGDAIEAGFYQLATYKGENQEEINAISKDIALYVYSTGDAGKIGSKVPVDYYMSDKEFARGIRRIRGTYNENMFNNEFRQTLIEQIVQNNASEYSKEFTFHSSEESESKFKSLLKPLIGNADNLSKVSTFTISRGDFKDAESIINSLTIPLTDREAAEAVNDKLNPNTIDPKTNKKVLKAKYPPFILITDSFASDFGDGGSRSVKYLYKRTSKALNEKENATYERINILGIKGIKEFDASPANKELKSVIKNNSTDTIVDSEMYPEDGNAIYGLTPDGFIDYSNRIQNTNEAKAKIAMQDFNIEKIKAGTKTTTTRSDKEFDKIGIPIGQSATVNFGGQEFIVTNRGLLTIEEAGGKEDMLKSEGYATVDDLLYQQTKDWINGKGKLYVYDIKPKQSGSGKVDNTNKPEFDKLPGKSATPTMTYAGIGSRETPQEILDLMTKAAEYLDGLGYTLRSGAADGADTAFEKGATKKEIFKGFDAAGETEVKIAHEIHPDLKGAMEASKNKKIKAKLAEGATKEEAEKSGERSAWAVQNLMARNTNQVFGKNLNSTSDFVLFYAKETDNPLRPKGGTGQAVEMARRKGIPTINMADANWRDQLSAVIKKPSTEEKGNKINIYSTDKNGFEDLSNFAERPFVVNGVTFPTVEHAYQWSKEMYYNTGAIDPSSDETPKDQEAKVKKHMADILAAKTGAEAKALGRKNIDVEFEKEIWDEESSSVMKMLIKKSFEQNPEAADKLLSTGEIELTHTQDKTKWATEFPKLLMEVREELRNPEEEDKTLSIFLQYGGKSYILEGNEEDGYEVYTTSRNKKSKRVTDKNLANKINLTNAVNMYPERVVTLTNMQHQPSYYVDFTGRVVSLTPSNYGGEIVSGDTYNRVMSIFKNEKLTPTQDQPGAIDPQSTKYVANYIDVNGRKLEVFKWDKDKKIAIKLTKDQDKAVRMMVSHFEKTPSVPFILKGKAGTGKTTVIRVINEYFKSKSSIIITPTHKAGKNASLVTYGNTQSRYKTFASSYYSDRANVREDILIFDEVSMLNDNDLALLEKKIKSGQMAIFMGDQRQLPPVKASKTSPFFNSKDNKNVYELKEVMRFDEQGSIFKIADKFAENLKNYGVIKQYPEKLISEKDAVYSVDSSKRLVDAYIHYYRLEGNDPSKVRIIAYGNKTAELYNNQIRNIVYKGDAQFNIINNNDLLIGNLGWSTKNVLESPMVNSSEYKVVEEPTMIKRTYQDFTFEGQRITYKEIVAGEFEAERTITVLDPEKEENKTLYGYIASTIANFKRIGKKYESHYNDMLNAVEKSGIYTLTTMYAKPTSTDPKTKEILSVELLTLEQMLKRIKQENPKLSEDEVLNMIDNDQVKEYYKIEPNLSFGYAITTHKSQGSTYKHVMVDESNMSFRDNTRRVDDQDDEFYAYEANQMRYVGFSRPTTTLVIYTKKPIGEELIYGDSKVTATEEEPPVDLGKNKGNIMSFLTKGDAISKIFGPSNEIKLSTKDILNNLYSKTGELNKQILSAISKSGGVGNLKIILDDKLENPGEYLDGVIRINPELAIGDDVATVDDAFNQLTEVIMHELLHHVTTDLLSANPLALSAEQRKWAVALKNLFKATQEKFLNDPKHSEALKAAIAETKKKDGFLSQADKSMYYGLTNVDDFVSMLMTDKTFRDLMNNTTYEGNKSMLDKFIEILGKILQALGVQVKDNSVLKEGITNIVGLIESRPTGSSESGAPFRSIATESAKTKLIKENFESIVKTLDIKTQC